MERETIDSRLDDEAVAVAAHFLLGRLGIVKAVVTADDRADELDPEVLAVLRTRSRVALDDIQTVLEDLARGLPPLLPTISSDVRVVDTDD